ncbi:MAG: hypothetical protein KA436_08350 [Oligoflexales bacterium]|nr:hypothetical protein [Oligoflexales bacterium]
MWISKWMSKQVSIVLSLKTSFILYKKIRSMIFFSCFFSQLCLAGPQIQIISFNILAPCYAHPDLYPKGALPLLDRNVRRERIFSFLQSIAPTTDIISLQETTQMEFRYIQEFLQENFSGFEVYHDQKYWSDWNTPDLEWEPNGVAIFLKKTSFDRMQFQDLPLSNSGNHGAYFEALHRASDIDIRGASIHFDSDRASHRNQELKALLSYMTPNPHKVDIIAGDFNYGTHAGITKRYLSQNRFTDVLHEVYQRKLGMQGIEYYEEWTSPYSIGIYRDKNLGIIDHITVRRAKAADGQVINFNLWSLYPYNEDARILASLKVSGSDHFPIRAVIEVSP